jgi:hypothetical protein
MMAMAMVVMMMPSAKVAAGKTTFMMMVVMFSMMMVVMSSTKIAASKTASAVMVMPSTKIAASKTASTVMVMPSTRETASAVMSVTHSCLLLIRFLILLMIPTYTQDQYQITRHCIFQHFCLALRTISTGSPSFYTDNHPFYTNFQQNS